MVCSITSHYVPDWSATLFPKPEMQISSVYGGTLSHYQGPPPVECSLPGDESCVVSENADCVTLHTDSGRWTAGIGSNLGWAISSFPGLAQAKPQASAATPPSATTSASAPDVSFRSAPSTSAPAAAMSAANGERLNPISLYLCKPVTTHIIHEVVVNTWNI